MQSLFKPGDNAQIVSRINLLTPHQEARWGKMNVSQMLLHCQKPLEVAFGETKPKRTFISFLLGRIVKKKLTKPAVRFSKSLPTYKSFIIRDQPDFEGARKKLIHLVTKFSTIGPTGITKDAHPVFGKLAPHEWDVLQWKHLDHHLSQFGV